ncbi:MAG: beta-ketoacyl-[acyl-carrier-protein] synthase II, partial [Lachnospiraceae bacterium]|nr:beta-ketoacyl-[acyl-carrier-protein] synthase II [Lachnospiraceae bacterium]
MKRRVVITGMGTVNPLGNNLSDTWENIKKGVCGIGLITSLDVTNHAVKVAGEVKNFDSSAVIDKKEARRMDRYSQFALVAADEAFNDSKLDMEKEDSSRCGVIFSSGIGGMASTEANMVTGQRRGFDKVSPFYIPMTIANMAAGNIAIRFGFKGMCTCV